MGVDVTNSDGRDVLLGQELNGKYRINRRIGAGGMGTVYEGSVLSSGEKCAIKVVLPNLVEDEIFLERFKREASITAQIKNPHVASVLEFAWLPNGAPYLVMEFLEGEDLSKRLRRMKTLPVADAKEIVDGVASALGQAHAAGVLHRDIKPANVFLAKRRDGASGELVKLLDFGASKRQGSDANLTNTGQVIGSVWYVSPEQARGQELDHRTDIFSLGVVVYELLTGHKPFEGESPTDTLFKIVSDPPIPLTQWDSNLPTVLEPVLSKALAKRREERFPTVLDFADALNKALDPSYVAPPRAAPPPPPPPPPPIQVSRQSGVIPIAPPASGGPPVLGPAATKAAGSLDPRQIADVDIVRGLRTAGLLGPEGFERAMAISPLVEGGFMADHLIEEGLLEERGYLRFRAQVFGMRFVTREKVSTVKLDGDALEKLPAPKAEEFMAIPVAWEPVSKVLTCTVADTARDLPDRIRAISGATQVQVVLATRQTVRQAIRRHYFSDFSAFEVKLDRPIASVPGMGGAALPPREVRGAGGPPRLAPAGHVPPSLNPVSAPNADPAALARQAAGLDVDNDSTQPGGGASRPPGLPPPGQGLVPPPAPNAPTTLPEVAADTGVGEAEEVDIVVDELSSRTLILSKIDVPLPPPTLRPDEIAAMQAAEAAAQKAAAPGAARPATIRPAPTHVQVATPLSAAPLPPQPQGPGITDADVPRSFDLKLDPSEWMPLGSTREETVQGVLEVVLARLFAQRAQLVLPQVTWQRSRVDPIEEAAPQPLIEAALQQNRPVLSATSEEGSYLPEREAMKARGVTSVVAAPLRLGAVSGALVIESATPMALESVRRLESLCAWATLRLTDAESVQAARGRAEMLRLLARTHGPAALADPLARARGLPDEERIPRVVLMLAFRSGPNGESAVRTLIPSIHQAVQAAEGAVLALTPAGVLASWPAGSDAAISAGRAYAAARAALQVAKAPFALAGALHLGEVWLERVSYGEQAERLVRGEAIATVEAMAEMALEGQLVGSDAIAAQLPSDSARPVARVTHRGVSGTVHALTV